MTLQAGCFWEVRGSQIALPWTVFRTLGTVACRRTYSSCTEAAESDVTSAVSCRDYHGMGGAGQNLCATSNSACWALSMYIKERWHHIGLPHGHKPVLEDYTWLEKSMQDALCMG